MALKIRICHDRCCHQAAFKKFEILLAGLRPSIWGIFLCQIKKGSRYCREILHKPSVVGCQPYEGPKCFYIMWDRIVQNGLYFGWVCCDPFGTDFVRDNVSFVVRNSILTVSF